MASPLLSSSRMACQRPKPQSLSLLSRPVAAARAAGLRYVTDIMAGIRRRWVSQHFTYIGVDGHPIHDPTELRRIKALAIPPAWTDVWICPSAEGHLQATGRDAKGRKQYRYHGHWRAVREETKYDHLLAFGQVLPRFRAQVERHLSLPGLPREKVLATVVRLLDTTFIRVGNEEYARTNRSFGLTTLRDHHVDIDGRTLRFQFRGKSGKLHTIDLHNQRLARIVKRCRELPGYELFQYTDADGQCQAIDSTAVNAYLREIAGRGFTAKDFRTWAGTVLVAVALRECEACGSPSQAKKHIVSAITAVAARLGNTPAICRKCYVHPAVLDGYLDGSLTRALAQYTARAPQDPPPGLRPDEAAVLAFLRRRLAPVSPQRREAA
jgi:DNA topoisomerase I